MKAVAVRGFRAAPEMIELPAPNVTGTEVSLRVAAAGVNPLDWKIVDGLYEGRRPHVFPLVLGVDGAGTIDRAGPEAAGFRPGERVFGQLLHDPVGVGTYAEVTTADTRRPLARVPAGLSMEVAAALPTAGMTALDTLDRLAIAAGETLLIVGAAGGVGTFATQLARARGARVLAVGRAANEPFLRGLGVERFLDREREDPLAAVRRELPDGVDAYLDVVSDATNFARMAGALRNGGRAASTVGAADPAALRSRGATAFNVDLRPTTALLDRLAMEALAGQLSVPALHQRPLSEGVAAVAESRAGRAVGKTVLVPGR
jgi:NADPH:quinone reductase